MPSIQYTTITSNVYIIRAILLTSGILHIGKYKPLRNTRNNYFIKNVPLVDSVKWQVYNLFLLWEILSKIDCVATIYKHAYISR